MTGQVRRYPLAFDRAWRPPPPPAAGAGEDYVPGLPSVTWGGLELNADERRGDTSADWLTSVVTGCEGWYASPPLEGQDADRALGDGVVWGPKRRGAREITIEGAAVGPRRAIMDLRDQLAFRAASPEPAELVVTDPWLRSGMSALVRADSDILEHEFTAGGHAYTWQVTLTAADPRLYDMDWQQLVLSTRTAADAGRPYPRLYWAPRDQPAPSPLNGWQYQSRYPPGSAGYLANRGSADAPVYAQYDGDLHASRLTDEDRSILLAPLEAGETILVDTVTTTAEAPGGAHRAQFVRPGSRPMSLAPFTTSRWHLYSQGSGSVTLSWRSAWW